MTIYKKPSKKEQQKLDVIKRFKYERKNAFEQRKRQILFMWHNPPKRLKPKTTEEWKTYWISITKRVCPKCGWGMLDAIQMWNGKTRWQCLNDECNYDYEEGKEE